MSTIPKPGDQVRGSRSGAPIMALLDLLGRRWAMGVLWNVCEQGILTFGGVQALCGGISPAALSQRLKELEEARLLVRAADGWMPTELGRRVYEQLLPLGATARDWQGCLASAATRDARGPALNGAFRFEANGHVAPDDPPEPLQAQVGDLRDETLWVPYRGSLVRLSTRDVVRVDAERDYVRVNDAQRSYLLRATMAKLCDRLGDRVLRIHRSTAIARDRVAALRHTGGGSWNAVDEAGGEFPIGRSYLPRVRAALM